MARVNNSDCRVGHAEGVAAGFSIFCSHFGPTPRGNFRNPLGPKGRGGGEKKGGVCVCVGGGGHHECEGCNVRASQAMITRAPGWRSCMHFSVRALKTKEGTIAAHTMLQQREL